MFNKLSRIFAVALVLGLAAVPARAADPAPVAGPVFMSADWAKQACDAWNADPVLTGELAKSGWIENDAKRGFRVMQI